MKLKSNSHKSPVDAVGTSFAQTDPKAGNEKITSTFIRPDGTIIEHRNDIDYTIYQVNDEDSWNKGGKSKAGLSSVGLENP